MKYKIHLTDNFLEEIDNIITFYQDKNISYSMSLLSRTENLIYSLEEMPERFAKIQDDISDKSLNVRQCVCDNYRIIYQIKNKDIYIISILGQNLLDKDKLK